MREENVIKAFEKIEIPAGMEQRIQEKLETSLGAPLRERRLAIRPRFVRWRPLLTAAAAVLLLFAAISAMRMSHASNARPAVQIPAARIVDYTKAERQNTPGDDYYLEKYADVLNRYRTALAEEADEEECESLGVSPLCRNYYGRDALQKLGYCLDDLNGDGVPELLIGCTDPNPADEDVILDLYKWYGGIGTQKVEESTAENRCYDCGEGLLRVERRWRADPYGMTGWTVYDLTAFKALVGDVTITAVNNEASLLAPVQPPENGFLASSEFTDTKLTPEEAKAWLERYCSVTVRHRYTPFYAGESLAVPTVTPEPDSVAGLTEEEYKALLHTLADLSRREEPFALAVYTESRSEDVVRLLEQIRLVARERGLPPSQYRGLLLGRLALDGASAEAYASLMGELYELDPDTFLSAWHEAGEPGELMEEITGIQDPVESKFWLLAQLERSKGSMLD